MNTVKVHTGAKTMNKEQNPPKQGWKCRYTLIQHLIDLVQANYSYGSVSDITADSAIDAIWDMYRRQRP